MRKIKAEPLTCEAYAPFGTFYSMTDPRGYSLNGELHRFFPDRMAESYLTTPEMILPLNDDMVLHVAPASAGTPVPELTKAFIVPKGTLVTINTAVWHLAPLPVSEPELQAMIILPECTYANDCTVVDFPEEDQFVIEL